MVVPDRSGEHSILNGASHIVRRHSGVIVLTMVLVLAFLLLWWLRNIALPFFIGLVLAYLLLPITSWIERKLPKPGKWSVAKRIAVIILIFILILSIIGSIGFYVVTAAINAFTDIVEDAPEYFTAALENLQKWLSNLRSWLPDTAENGLAIDQNLGNFLGEAVQNLFTGIINWIPSSFTYISGFATLPIFLFYILKDHELLSKSFLNWLPGKAGNHLRNTSRIITNVLGGYLRAQLVTGLFVGTLAFIGLVIIIDLPIAVGLGVVAGITELVPVLGPWIGGVIAGLVILAIDPGKVIWVVVIFFAVQLIENSLLVPRIQGQFMHIHPAVAVVLIIVGAAVAGFWGLVLAVPLASTVVQLYRYVLKVSAEENEQNLIIKT